MSSAEAQPDAAREGLTEAALCGLVATAFPTCPERVALSASAGYGYTESIGPVSGAHHRLHGTLGVGVVPLPWLSLALRLDGRVDLHPRDALGDNRTGTGDPRLLVRMGGAASERLSLGGEAVLWFPGNDAPSFEPRATTVDLKALLAYRFARSALLLNAGVRIDQSARSAPDLSRLRSGDRIALGLSDSHAVLIALGVSTRALSNSELFGELSVDLLVGSAAPELAQSPLRLTVGARRFFSRRLQGELSATASLSQRPGIAATDPLVAIDPRFGVRAGMRYGFVEPPLPPPPPQVDEVVAEVEPPKPRFADLAGELTDASSAPLPDVRVLLRTPADDTREAVSDGEGRYAFDQVPVGPVTLETSAPGFAPERWQVDVLPGMAPQPARALAAKANVGTLRVVTRTFTSEPLQASVLVNDAAGRRVADGKSDGEGRFELDLPPGRYVVTISAPKHRPHRRDVQIERYGVAIMNVDMREQR